MFAKYQHIEKFGTDETLNIEMGTCYLFPKIDGTNSSVWIENGVIKAGSRNRELSLDNDNAGFYEWVLKQENIKNFLVQYPHLRLFGEWLVPHSLKTYRESAWRNFYVFDVCQEREDGTLKYLSYENYKIKLDEFGINYIPPIRIIRNGSYEDFVKVLSANNYLIKDGEGTGEGLVIKNYSYENKYKRQTWAKIITSEFKELHHKEMGAPEVDGKLLVEDEIINQFCTEALITKTFEKIKNENEGWASKYIPQLLGRVWHDLITEETWNFIKKLKNPTVNFRTLQYKVTLKIKDTLPTIF